MPEFLTEKKRSTFVFAFPQRQKTCENWLFAVVVGSSNICKEHEQHRIKPYIFKSLQFAKKHINNNANKKHKHLNSLKTTSKQVFDSQTNPLRKTKSTEINP